MFKKALITLLVTGASIWASPSRAANITFDPTGGAGATVALQENQMNSLPGNIDSIGGGATGTPASVESVFQSNLDSFVNTGDPSQKYSNGQTGFGTQRYFTIVAGIPEKVDNIVSVPGQDTVTFAFNGSTPATPTATNYFYIYETTNVAQVTGNDLSGVCFTCGTLVLSGYFNNDSTFQNTFVVDTSIASPGPLLDQFNTANYPTTHTLTGVGSFHADITVFSASNAFFPGLTPGGVINWRADTFTNDPYFQTDPSACFDVDGLVPTVCYGGAGTANIGNINGESNDILLQSHPTFSFLGTPSAVPEPATLTLLGIGLLGSGAARRRQKKNKK